MLQNTIDSWGFFLENATGDCIFMLAESLGANRYSPEAILNRLFQQEYKGNELSYEAYLFDLCRKRGLLSESLPIERMEDHILVNILSTTTKRCTEDERDCLVDLLGFGNSLDKKSFSKELLDRAPSMDKYLLPSILLLLCGPYYKNLDFMTWPFRLDRQQLSTIGQAQNHAKIPNSDWIPLVFISFHRSRWYSSDTGSNSQTQIPIVEETKQTRKAGRPGGNWLTETYKKKYSLEEVDERLNKGSIWKSILEITREVRLSPKSGWDAYKSLSAAILLYTLQEIGIAQKSTAKSIPASFEKTVRFLGKGYADVDEINIGAGALSRSSISPYWVAMRDLFSKLCQAHLNNRWSDLKDIKQTTILSGGRPQQTVFFDRNNIEIIRQSVELLRKKLPELLPL